MYQYGLPLLKESGKSVVLWRTYMNICWLQQIQYTEHLILKGFEENSKSESMFQTKKTCISYLFLYKQMHVLYCTLGRLILQS